MRRALLFLASALAGPALAQTVPVVADTGAGVSLGTTVAQSGQTFTIDGGTRTGANLFHSFSRFGLDAGQTARWVSNDATNVRHVINRVTGGQESRILGTLDSRALPNADFWLINPAGIVFGAGARLDVPASAHFATASDLRLADGARFAIATPGGSTLSMAAPETFGFVGGEAAITASSVGAGFATPAGALTLTAPQVRLADSRLGGRSLAITAGLAQVESTFLEVETAGAPGVLRVDADEVRLTESTLSSRATGAATGGRIEVTADTLLTSDTAILSVAAGTGQGGDIRLEARLQEHIDSIIATEATDDGTPGRVTLIGDEIYLFGGVFGSSPGGMAQSGDLTIAATSVIEALGSVLTTATFTDGGAGSITLTAPRLYLGDSIIEANAFAGGAAGSIRLEGDEIVLDETRVEAESRGLAAARPGEIVMLARGDVLLNQSSITSSAFGGSSGGRIRLEARDVELRFTTLQADAFAEGDAGGVDVNAQTLTLFGSQISSDTAGIGDAGDVAVTTASLILDNESAISSDTRDFGDAGSVFVRSNTLDILGSSAITSKAIRGSGQAGAVRVEANQLFMQDGLISSDTSGGGDAGAVFVRANSIVMDGFRRAFTYISSDTLSEGSAGDVTIEAGTLELFDQAFISSNALGTGDAGSVNVTARILKVLDGSYIASDANSFGDAGPVTVRADELLLDGNGAEITYISSDTLGQGDAGPVRIFAKSLTVRDGAFISSDTYDFGLAGDVVVEAGTVKLETRGSIRSGTFSSGPAGDVAIRADTLRVDSGGAVSSEAFEGSEGDAGFIGIDAKSITVVDEGRISTASAGSGDAGAVFIRAGDLIVDGGRISSAAQVGATGGSGALLLDAERLSVIGGGEITTVSNNPNPAGLIEINAGEVALSGAGSTIASENQAGAVALGNPRGQSGDAGAVDITAGSLSIADGASISTNAFAGAAGAIRITMPEASRLVLEGGTAPGRIETSSGSGTGGRITIAAPKAIISKGGSILALGERQGANVAIQTGFFINASDRVNTVAVDGNLALEGGVEDVSSGTVERDLSVLDASRVLRGQCPVARATGQVSQLITRPVGPHAAEPAPGAETIRTGPEGACP